MKTNPSSKKLVKAEVIQEPQVPVVTPIGIVRPLVTAQEALEAWKAYQDLKTKLLDPSDYQVIVMFQAGKGSVKKPFVKKSGWRKLATAFNISDEVIKEERKEYTDEKGNKYFVQEVTARATASNGRIMDGTGSCASNERGFAHLEHDVRATAETRGKNRAIADMIGGGDVSAEEVEQQEEAKKAACEVNHDDLPQKEVTMKGPNKGRPYVRCTKCAYFKWMAPANNPEQIDGEVK